MLSEIGSYDSVRPLDSFDLIFGHVPMLATVINFDRLRTCHVRQVTALKASWPEYSKIQTISA